MSNIVLPKELRYNDSLPQLPSGAQSLEQYLSPVNGNQFSCKTAGTIIQFDLPQRGFLVPSSMYIKYHYKVTDNTGGVSSIRGCPVYSCIQKMETIFGSQTVESISNYNQVMHMYSNLTMDVAQKYGCQNAYGYYANTGTPDLNSVGDGRVCTASEDGSFSAPIFNILSQSDNYVPLGMMPNVRVQLTLDSIANIFDQQTALKIPTEYLLTQVELCFTLLDFGEQVMNICRNMGEKIYIKSQSLTASTNNIAANAVGTIELVYSQRLASIKSLFLISPCGAASTASVNGIFDSYDITNGGSYQFSIAGKYYPPKPIDCGQNKTSAYMELKKAVGSLWSTNNSFSINAIEFNAVPANSTSISAPGKFIVGVNTELLPQSSNVLLTGTSTQNSPITVRMYIATASAVTLSPTLVCLYDALIEIIPSVKQASVKQ
jgi:hypothetical protein